MASSSVLRTGLSAALINRVTAFFHDVAFSRLRGRQRRMLYCTAQCANGVCQQRLIRLLRCDFRPQDVEDISVLVASCPFRPMGRRLRGMSSPPFPIAVIAFHRSSSSMPSGCI
jgi:hypothetical protein